MTGKGASKLRLIIYAFLLAVILQGLGQILIGMSGWSLPVELAIFLFLVVLAVQGFVGYFRGWGENFFLFLFLLYLGNLVLIWYLSGLFYLVLLVLTLVGFVMGILKEPGLKKQKQQQKKRKEKVSTLPPEPLTRKLEKKSANFSPGKYVASSRSNTYHEPKCEWAKKIRAKKIWFSDKKEAEDKKYKAHSCVK